MYFCQENKKVIFYKKVTHIQNMQRMIIKDKYKYRYILYQLYLQINKLYYFFWYPVWYIKYQKRYTKNNC